MLEQWCIWIIMQDPLHPLMHRRHVLLRRSMIEHLCKRLLLSKVQLWRSQKLKYFGALMYNGFILYCIYVWVYEYAAASDFVFHCPFCPFQVTVGASPAGSKATRQALPAASPVRSIRSSHAVSYLPRNQAILTVLIPGVLWYMHQLL